MHYINTFYIPHVGNSLPNKGRFLPNDTGPNLLALQSLPFNFPCYLLIIYNNTGLRTE